ncbi:hypothetical protein [Aquibium oceanicum]|uniref:Uncharacterized protein n=1 Tax=Aquibium oceanicum TaxID=1670800 RepID=A0A1L3SXG3_9HYPH|nr:hypothetical protein [Aquibium oceanicum]APH74116.1 hypothetical protein BSQ44_24165 [Aquibium oceanicum]
MTPHIISGNTVTVFIGGDLRTIDSSHPNFTEIKDALREDQPVEDLIDISAALRKQVLYEDDLIRVGYDTLNYNDQPLHNYLTQRIIEMAKYKQPIAPWIAFLKRVQMNPDQEIRDDLFEWLEHAGMPITPDGYFLAYKKVRDDYLSFHDGKTRNDVGSTIFLPREECDPDRFSYCSSGLHFCSWHYLGNYLGDQGKVLVLKINPADVVAFPRDDTAKGRAWRYTIVDEVEAEKAEWAFPKPVYTTVYDDPDNDAESPTIFGRIRAWTRRWLN